jgi:hypothetical protein
MNRKKKFIEIAPEMAEARDAQFRIPQEIITLVVDLSQNRRLITPTTSKKAIYRDLRNYAGDGIVCSQVVKLAVTLGLLCQQLADGEQKETVHAYLDYRIAAASFYYGWVGRDLLAVVTDMVQSDLDGYPNRKFPLS